MLEMEQTDSSKLVQMNTHGEDEDSHGSYLKFFVMIGASMVIMYLLTYLNSYQIIEHAHFSETRLYMTTLMGGAMMAIMLFFMLGMYKNSKANSAIFVAAGLLMLLSIWLVRSQITVNGVDYMEAMIPHHSIAILTSERAGIEDPRVRELADQIIEAQRKEIKEMEWLIDDIKTNGLARTEEEAAARPVPQFTASP
jgi:FlaA1/EpsC-like NDP-sugar epimerase